MISALGVISVHCICTVKMSHYWVPLPLSPSSILSDISSAAWNGQGQSSDTTKTSKCDRWGLFGFPPKRWLLHHLVTTARSPHAPQVGETQSAVPEQDGERRCVRGSRRGGGLVFGWLPAVWVASSLRASLSPSRTWKDWTRQFLRPPLAITLPGSMILPLLLSQTSLELHHSGPWQGREREGV